MLRKIATTVAAASALLVVPALPGQAAPSSGCPYPINRPVLSLSATPATVIASHNETAYGKFSQNSCGIKNATITLQRRALVNGKPSGSWTTFATLTTNKNGAFATTRKPLRNEQQRAVFTKSGKFASTTSKSITVHVRDRITATLKNTAPCLLAVSGGTYPAKARHTVYIQTRGPVGHFNGWTTLWTATTGSKGGFSTSHKLTCGKTYNISVWIRPDATDLGNRTATVYGVKPFEHAQGF